MARTQTGMIGSGQCVASRLRQSCIGNVSFHRTDAAAALMQPGPCCAHSLASYSTAAMTCYNAWRPCPAAAAAPAARCCCCLRLAQSRTQPVARAQHLCCMPAAAACSCGVCSHRQAVHSVPLLGKNCTLRSLLLCCWGQPERQRTQPHSSTASTSTIVQQAVQSCRHSLELSQLVVGGRQEASEAVSCQVQLLHSGTCAHAQYFFCQTLLACLHTLDRPVRQ